MITNKEIIENSVRRINGKIAPSNIKVEHVAKRFEISIDGTNMSTQTKGIDVITWLDGFEFALDKVHSPRMKGAESGAEVSNDIFEVVGWPEVQNYMEQPGWESNSQLIDNDTLYKQYGDSAYFVNKKWLNEQDHKLGIA